VVYTDFGEGKYEPSEAAIEQLLAQKWCGVRGLFVSQCIHEAADTQACKTPGSQHTPDTPARSNALTAERDELTRSRCVPGVSQPFIVSRRTA
jgi:hypothetical protein